MKRMGYMLRLVTFALSTGMALLTGTTVTIRMAFARSGG